MSYTIEIEDVAPQLVAATKLHSSTSEIGEDIGAGLRLLGPPLYEACIEPTGAPLAVYHDALDDEGEIEFCVPITVEFSARVDVYSRQLEGGRVATTLHQGEYEDIASAYQTLASWISRNGHKVSGPPREVYLDDPRVVETDKLRTRIEFPIGSLAA